MSDGLNYLHGTEAANEVEPDASRTFRPAYLNRPMSLWPAMLVVLTAVVGCGGFLVWTIYQEVTR